jgi:glucose-fructose oxidoreductase
MNPRNRDRIRWAVVGAGHISQVAVLPGFANADNAELAAIVSGDPLKRDRLGQRYGVRTHDYEDYDALLDSGTIDAVYIALPNHLHCEYTVRAAERGVNVLCEKPMAVDERECHQMLRAVEDAGVHLMIAYRLHFEPAHMQALEIARSGDLGRLRYIHSAFSQNVQPGNVRLMATERGGGPLYDMGIYCLNAARYFFRDEPLTVQAVECSRSDPRFARSPETMAVTLTFPGERIASFVCGFGSADVSTLTVVGEEGSLTLDPAYEYAEPLRFSVSIGNERRTRRFTKHDQFGAELVYFSDCIRDGIAPEPDGLDGLADVHAIRMAHESARVRQNLPLLAVRQRARPQPAQAIVRPGISPPEEVHASSPSGD